MAAAMDVHVKCPTKDVQKLLTRYPVLKYQKETNKVTCSLSGHEMPCKADVILSYVSGKKFLKLYKDKEFGYEKYEPHLIPSIKKRQEHLLFCKLTLRHINKTPRDVERHVSGKRYKKALERWQKCQESGETFQPLGKRKKKEPEAQESEGEIEDFWQSEGEESAEDSDMADLYPDEDFENVNREEMEEGSDSEDSDVESEMKVSNADRDTKAVTSKAKDMDSSEDENNDVKTKDHSKSKKAQIDVTTKRTNTKKKKKQNKSKRV